MNLRSSAAKFLHRFARRKRRVIPLIFGLSLTISAVLTSTAGVPQPFIHDEWCYLLQADTFRHGRLTNPTPAGWEQFETFHVLMTPSYQAKYPPGQGLALALGWALAGLPIVGAWLAAAAACAAVSWMLYRLLPPVWALLGSLLTVIHPVVLQWAQSYWGGAVAMLGGALLLGAAIGVVRSLRKPRGKLRIGDGAILASALIVLFNSRPFEGFFVLGGCIACLIGWNLWKHRKSQLQFRGCAAAFALILLVGGSWTGYYNHRVTGSVWRLPYVEYESQYEISTPFLWLRPHAEPVYRWPQLRQWFVEYQLDIYKRQQSAGGLASELWREKLPALAQLFPSKWVLHWLREVEITKPAVVVPFWMIAFSITALIPAWWMEFRAGRNWVRFAILACAACLAATCSEILIWPHYAAAFLPCVIYLIAAGVRRTWFSRLLAGPRIVPRMAVVVVLAFCTIPAILWASSPARYWETGWQYQKLGFTGDLEQMGGKHLVFVRYLAGHDIHHDWVFNGADFNDEPVLWARDGGNASNVAIARLYSNRQIWLLEEDGKSCRLLQYRP